MSSDFPPLPLPSPPSAPNLQSRRNSCIPPTDVFPPAPMLSKEKSTMDNSWESSSMIKKLRLILTGTVVVLGGSFHFGYQISTHETSVDEFSQRIVWPSVAGLLFIGAFIGALFSPRAMQQMGLRAFFSVSSVILLSSFLLSFSSKYFQSAELFVFGRFLSGIGIGTFTSTQAVYLSEISPIRFRGVMGSLTGFSKSIGFVLASGIGIPQILGTSDLWHWAYLIECVPSIMVLIGMLFFFYDSPVYLIKNGEDKQAYKCLELYHTTNRAQQRMPEIYAELERDKRNHAEGKTTLAAMFNYIPARKAFFICVLINTTVSFSGIMAVSFFGTFLLQGIGFTENGAAIANCFASFSGLLGNVVGTLTIDKIGRRKLIIGGLLALAALNSLLMFLVYLFKFTEDVNTGYAFLVVFMLFLFVFSLGVGPLALFIATELTTADFRPLMQSASIATQYLTCFISPLIFFPAYDIIGPLTFMIFIVPLLLTSTYLYFALPETKNRPIEHIVDELAGLDPSATSSQHSLPPIKEVTLGAPATFTSTSLPKTIPESVAVS
uniref:Major facilitator superfamily (MFS) profile domain-containing protein n=1 Tax=Panagrolaimus sp. ES5 TaxID=591445 RepID=A0AC34F7S7_9BILA